MNNLFISYDLISPGQNYEAVTDAIKKLGSWAKVHLSLFYVSTEKTAQQAAEIVWKSMDENDKLIVITAADSYWHNLSIEVSEHIQKNWNR